MSPNTTVLLSLFTALASAATAAPSKVPSIAFGEVSRKVVNLNDHTVTLIRVRPPVLPKAPPPPAPPPITPEEQAASDRMAEKAYAMLNVTATVYIGGKTPVSVLRWHDATGALGYVAYSNIDFRYLTQLSTLETETTVYSWFPFVDAYKLSDWPADQPSPIPVGLAFSSSGAEYFVDSRAKELNSQETTLAGLDYLHAYYQLHYAELKAGFEKREAENAERERQLRENPPKTPNVTLRWWPLSANSSSR